MRVCVSGSRSFIDYDLLVQKYNEILTNENPDKLEFVCGLAEGADKLGERYAKERGCAIKYFPAHFNRKKGVKTTMIRRMITEPIDSPSFLKALIVFSARDEIREAIRILKEKAYVDNERIAVLEKELVDRKQLRHPLDMIDFKKIYGER